jgi:chemotaxis protein methyltransferase CheR
MMTSPKKFLAPPLDDFTKSQVLFKSLVDDSRGFHRMSEMIRSLLGINLIDTEKNRTLLAGRLSHTFKELGFSNYGDFMTFLELRPELFHQFLVSRVTTNTTQFFREGAHFGTLVRELAKMKRRPLRIWCAACSTGQEAYTILMSLFEAGIVSSKNDVEFLATDIDREVLRKAEAGIYSPSEVAMVPGEYLKKYFVADGAKGGYKVAPKLRDLIHFAPFNLVKDPCTFKTPFDVIFCRNVLIYFEREEAREVVSKLTDQLQVGGKIFLGHAETAAAVDPRLKSLVTAAYERKK